MLIFRCVYLLASLNELKYREKCELNGGKGGLQRCHLGYFCCPMIPPLRWWLIMKICQCQEHLTHSQSWLKGSTGIFMRENNECEEMWGQFVDAVSWARLQSRIQNLPLATILTFENQSIFIINMPLKNPYHQFHMIHDSCIHLGPGYL